MKCDQIWLEKFQISRASHRQSLFLSLSFSLALTLKLSFLCVYSPAGSFPLSLSPAATHHISPALCFCTLCAWFCILCADCRLFRYLWHLTPHEGRTQHRHPLPPTSTPGHSLKLLYSTRYIYIYTQTHTLRHLHAASVRFNLLPAKTFLQHLNSQNVIDHFFGAFKFSIFPRLSDQRPRFHRALPLSLFLLVEIVVGGPK